MMQTITAIAGPILTFASAFVGVVVVIFLLLGAYQIVFWRRASFAALFDAFTKADIGKSVYELRYMQRIVNDRRMELEAKIQSEKSTQSSKKEYVPSKDVDLAFADYFMALHQQTFMKQKLAFQLQANAACMCGKSTKSVRMDFRKQFNLVEWIESGEKELSHFERLKPIERVVRYYTLLQESSNVEQAMEDSDVPDESFDKLVPTPFQPLQEKIRGMLWRLRANRVFESIGTVTFVLCALIPFGVLVYFLGLLLLESIQR